MKTTIDIVLDECIEEVRRGANVEDVLKKYPVFSDELRPLLDIAQDLKALPDPESSLEGLMRALSQQIARESEVPSKPSAAKITLFSRPVLLRLVASLALIFLVGGGTFVASANAVPGNPLYAVKRAAEKVRLLFTLNDRNEAELRITFSERRLSEALLKYQQGGGIDDGLLRQMLDEGRLALEHTLSLTPDERSYLFSRVSYLTAHQMNVIETVKQTATPTEQTALAPVREMCGRRMQWMKQGMKSARMASPSRSGCWGAPPEASQDDAVAMPKPDDGPLGQKSTTMRKWIESCPTWAR